MSAQPNCDQRIDAELQSTLDTLRKLWTAYCEGDEDRHIDDIGTFAEYGLSFDYVAPDTFDNQPQGYFRYQLSYGGPSDEFRFYVHPALSYRGGPPNLVIEYWFMDWFDGANRELDGHDAALLAEIYQFFDEVGSTKAAFEDATD